MLGELLLFFLLIVGFSCISKPQKIFEIDTNDPLSRIDGTSIVVQWVKLLPEIPAFYEHRLELWLHLYWFPTNAPKKEVEDGPSTMSLQPMSGTHMGFLAHGFVLAFIWMNIHRMEHLSLPPILPFK